MRFRLALFYKDMSTIEKISQLSLILTCGVAVFVMIGNWRQEHPEKTDPQTAAAKSIGRPLPVQGVPWNKSKVNVVLAVSSKCKFCLASMPLYRKIAAIGRDHGSEVSLLAISPEPRTQIGAFLSEQQVTVDDVYSASFAKIGVRATPTVFLTDSKGVIRDVFVGQLTEPRAAALLKVVSQGLF